jgi:hypothetical protein
MYYIHVTDEKQGTTMLYRTWVLLRSVFPPSGPTLTFLVGCFTEVKSGIKKSAEFRFFKNWPCSHKIDTVLKKFDTIHPKFSKIIKINQVRFFSTHSIFKRRVKCATRGSALTLSFFFLFKSTGFGRRRPTDSGPLKSSTRRRLPKPLVLIQPHPHPHRNQSPPAAVRTPPPPRQPSLPR